jgi:hypothetical protein
MTRRIDRALLDLNARGAINGHVPITAIVTSLAALAAAALGRGTVLVSNEGSADEPTRVVDGWRINHQHSKSRAFELLLDAALAEAGDRRARRVAAATVRRARDRPIRRRTTPGPHRAGHQLQRGLRDGPARADGWCGRCDEVPLRPARARTVHVTPAPQLVADARLRRARRRVADGRGFAEICSMPTTKPFECVGTVEEVRLALDLLATRPDWLRCDRRASGMRASGCDCTGGDVTDARLRRLTEALTPRRPSRMPPAPFDALARPGRSHATEQRPSTEVTRMIVVLGHGRETQRMARAPPTLVTRATLVTPVTPVTRVEPVLVLDERRRHARRHHPDGHDRRQQVDLDDVDAVRTAPSPADDVDAGRALTRHQPLPARTGVARRPRLRAPRRPACGCASAAPDDLVLVTGTKGKSTVTR